VNGSSGTCQNVIVDVTPTLAIAQSGCRSVQTVVGCLAATSLPVVGEQLVTPCL
jgi:hypothetical protein